MNTTKCRVCGKEYTELYAYNNRTCDCGGRLEGGFCAICGDWYDKLNASNLRCTKCATEEHRRWRYRRFGEADTRFKNWMERISSLIDSFKPLTEQEWLRACKHFGGCAYCGSENIDARSMFIDYEHGGRYASWNIVPACERCEASLKIDPNPFKRMDNKVQYVKGKPAKKYGYTLENLQRIEDYLGEQADASKT